MPKKDPVTGCMVMTMGECLQDMADKEGKGRDGWEIYGEIVDEMADDDRKQEEYMRSPEGALERVEMYLKDAREYWEDMYGEGTKPPTIVEVVKVIEAQSSHSFKTSGEKFVAEVKDDAGRLLYVYGVHSYWSGTRLEPPEEDSEFYIGEFRPMSEHPWKCYVCGRVREKGARHWTHIEQSDNPKMAVHSCPRCNGYEREQNKKRRAAMKKVRK